jgi:hypothetical protein
MPAYNSPSQSAVLQATADQDRLWVRINVLVTLLTELRTSNVYSDAGRAAAMENVTSMVMANPYTIVDGSTEHLTAIRFSAPTNAGSPIATAIFVALFRDGWAEIFASLVAALSTPLAADPDLLAVPQFYAALGAAGTNVRNSIGLYNFLSFEQEYQLTWS